MENWLTELVQNHSSVATLVEAGRSYQNRVIRGVKISYSPANANNVVFIESGIHAREW